MGVKEAVAKTAETVTSKVEGLAEKAAGSPVLEGIARRAQAKLGNELDAEVQEEADAQHRVGKQVNKLVKDEAQAEERREKAEAEAADEEAEAAEEKEKAAKEEANAEKAQAKKWHQRAADWARAKWPGAKKAMGAAGAAAKKHGAALTVGAVAGGAAVGALGRRAARGTAGAVKGAAVGTKNAAVGAYQGTVAWYRKSGALTVFFIIAFAFAFIDIYTQFQAMLLRVFMMAGLFVLAWFMLFNDPKIPLIVSIVAFLVPYIGTPFSYVATLTGINDLLRIKAVIDFLVVLLPVWPVYVLFSMMPQLEDPGTLTKLVKWVYGIFLILILLVVPVGELWGQVAGNLETPDVPDAFNEIKNRFQDSKDMFAVALDQLRNAPALVVKTWNQQIAYATGEYVDGDAVNESVGVELRSQMVSSEIMVEPDGQDYIDVGATLIAYNSKNQPMNIYLSCESVKNPCKTDSCPPIDGPITPPEYHDTVVYDDVTCYPKFSGLGNHEVTIKATVRDFPEKAHLTNYFVSKISMESEIKRYAERYDSEIKKDVDMAAALTEIYGVDSTGRSVSDVGPAKLIIGIQRMPVIAVEQDSQVKVMLVIENRVDGQILKVTSATIEAPDGFTPGAKDISSGEGSLGCHAFEEKDGVLEAKEAALNAKNYSVLRKGEQATIASCIFTVSDASAILTQPNTPNPRTFVASVTYDYEASITYPRVMIGHEPEGGGSGGSGSSGTTTGGCAVVSASEPMPIRSDTPCLSAKFIDEKFRAAGSPLAGLGNVMVEESRKTGIGNDFVLAILAGESTYATADPDGWAASGANNPGNIKKASAECGGMTCQGVINDFCVFPSWEAGVRAVFTYINNCHLYSDDQSVRDVIETYCPVSDGCGTETYISNIRNWMNDWRAAQPQQQDPYGGQLQFTGQLTWPTKAIRIMSCYGPRNYLDGFHDGMDFDTGYKRPVYAAGDGVVYEIETSCKETEGDASCGHGYGNYVRIKHNDNLYTQYGHLFQVTASVGQVVKGNQEFVIGETGDTGIGSGAHLDFKISTIGTFGRDEGLNPLCFISPPPGGFVYDSYNCVGEYGPPNEPASKTQKSCSSVT